MADVELAQVICPKSALFQVRWAGCITDGNARRGKIFHAQKQYGEQDGPQACGGKGKVNDGP